MSRQSLIIRTLLTAAAIATCAPAENAAFEASSGSQASARPEQAENHGPVVEDIGIQINEVILNLNGVARDIGDIAGNLTSPPAGDITATFTVAPNYQFICKCTEFHWIQIVLSYGCLAGQPGIRRAGVNLPTPVSDPPDGGWDYMYMDGAARTNPDPNFAALFIDSDPWYWNAGGEAQYYAICQTYSMNDNKSAHLCQSTDPIVFRTWLVAKEGADICLLRGFQWSVSKDANVVTGDLGAPTAAHAAQVKQALDNGQINGWTVKEKCNITTCTCQPAGQNAYVEIRGNDAGGCMAAPSPLTIPLGRCVDFGCSPGCSGAPPVHINGPDPIGSFDLTDCSGQFPPALMTSGPFLKPGVYTYTFTPSGSAGSIIVVDPAVPGLSTSGMVVTVFAVFSLGALVIARRRSGWSRL